MKKLLFIVPLGLLFACGDSTQAETPVVLNTAEDKIGYVLGALNAESILQSGDKMKDLDKDELIAGFNENLNKKDCSECDDELKKLFGPYYQDFDTTYLKSGSKCLGRKTGFSFYADMLRMGGDKKINLDMVKAGFKHGLYETDTLIADQDRQTLVQNFIMDLNVINSDKMMANAKKINGVQVFDNGIVLQTIKEGTGENPTEKDDVIVEYILTNALGDTVQSSYQMKKMSGSTEPVALSLDGGVIPGWSFVLPKMKKGGKYRTYIPWQLAYGEQAGKESLCFVIELVEIGPGGTLVKPQAPMPQQQQGF
jgi:FKBP-type peptidyl-prolyl cis-trans isomerase